MQVLMEQTSNKEFLRSIAANGYEIPDDLDPYEFAKALLPNLASTDGELRDELSYMIFANGIIDKQKLTLEQLEALLTLAQDEDHLFYQIKEPAGDGVFMRSFSNLLIAAILYNDAGNPGLSAPLLQRTKKSLIEYAHAEKDWRGYIAGKGWAHAMAHLADVLDECAQNRVMEAGDRQDILEVVSELARLSEPLYHEEDVRLASVAYHIILGKQVPDDFLRAWVDSCLVVRDSDVSSWTRSTNAKNFLRSLYFFLHWDTLAPALLEHIAHVLMQLDDVYVEKRRI